MLSRRIAALPSLVTLSLLTTLFSTTSAQSALNDNVCFAPVNGDGSIGNVSFDSVIADNPLFWIATVRHDNDRIMTRQFHLFTEDRALQLGTNTTDFNGCALALTGVMKTDREAMLPEVDGQGDPGCDAVLGNECAADVLERARTELEDVLRNGTGREVQAQSVCGELRDRLFASSRPGSCEVNVWASISDMVLTGTETDVMNTTFVEGESDCDDGMQVSELYDQGQTFALFPLASFKVPDDGDLMQSAEWIRAATPMISLFWANDGSDGAVLGQLDVSVNCVSATNDKEAKLPDVQAEEKESGADRSSAVPAVGLVLLSLLLKFLW